MIDQIRGSAGRGPEAPTGVLCTLLKSRARLQRSLTSKKYSLYMDGGCTIHGLDHPGYILVRVLIIRLDRGVEQDRKAHVTGIHVYRAAVTVVTAYLSGHRWLSLSSTQALEACSKSFSWLTNATRYLHKGCELQDYESLCDPWPVTCSTLLCAPFNQRTRSTTLRNLGEGFLASVLLYLCPRSGMRN
jgi:hypothetical protein